MNGMRERPILFSAPMVRAILAGTKTKTRRVVKPQPQPNGGAGLHPVRPYRTPAGDWNWVLSATGMGCGDPFPCPYGQPGDRLWVRESVRAADLDDFSRAVEYLADGACVQVASAEDIESEAFGRWEKLNLYRSNDAALDGGKTVPPMHMPRLASRIDLEITGVRVERLNAISEADAAAEGIIKYDMGGHGPLFGTGYPDTDPCARDTPVGAYAALWESINGAGSWDANPWVWVVEFQRVDQRSKV